MLPHMSIDVMINNERNVMFFMAFSPRTAKSASRQVMSCKVTFTPGLFPGFRLVKHVVNI